VRGKGECLSEGVILKREGAILRKAHNLGEGAILRREGARLRKLLRFNKKIPVKIMHLH